ncbi:TRAP-type mannitol/chloroaromatic compound transport system substrate-binding protein [Litoreibacter meonggei]|uniref:TRAP-type mannitol/chloroaromatic compound transport system substrate-binding protein n=1 Tax=Litoreibacter meonggei TaxID=1049199 RepID=A0A497VPW4_9RHOB|nr:TRAP transporter substrate-binding protein [Litoreibacter meonggei]RLJ40984.1 TRAP-type mannitol/chloroaromatic compound transport system substrate-binding protein [Litoreibacter meonggei]
MNNSIRTVMAAATALGFCATAALADGHAVKLRIQNHQGPESTVGILIADFVDRVHAMSDGSIEIEMFYSSSVVKSVETFDAATSGILDCDMTNGSYQTGKNPAFQFVADTMGGYDTPLQYQTWVNYGGGKEVINELYSAYGMTFIGAHVGGQESLNSTRPLNGVADLKDFKFRSPPGMESEIFASLGAKPIVMDFTEIFTALETKIIDGADAATLAVNRSLGIYDIAKHTTYPGFHSMSSDHLACRTDVWESLTPAQQTIIETAEKALAMDLMMSVIVQNGEALAELPAEGVTVYDWSAEDRATFRAAAQGAWTEWATRTPETAKIVHSHKAFLKRIGLTD